MFWWELHIYCYVLDFKLYFVVAQWRQKFSVQINDANCGREKKKEVKEVEIFL